MQPAFPSVQVMCQCVGLRLHREAVADFRSPLFCSGGSPTHLTPKVINAARNTMAVIAVALLHVRLRKK